MVTLESLEARKDRIAVVGLGYVGLPLAVRLAKHFDVVGYDLMRERIAGQSKALSSGFGRARPEVSIRI